MTNTCLTLEGVSFTLADGRVLFQDLNDVFDQRRTGLAGRNGIRLRSCYCWMSRATTSTS